MATIEHLPMIPLELFKFIGDSYICSNVFESTIVLEDVKEAAAKIIQAKLFNRKLEFSIPFPVIINVYGSGDLGVFALQDIPAGTLVEEFVGVVKEHVDETKNCQFMKLAGAKLYFDATSSGNVSKYFRTSEGPSLVASICAGCDGLLHLVFLTKCHVKAGDELTYESRDIPIDYQTRVCICPLGKCRFDHELGIQGTRGDVGFDEYVINYMDPGIQTVQSKPAPSLRKRSTMNHPKFEEISEQIGGAVRKKVNDFGIPDETEGVSNSTPLQGIINFLCIHCSAKFAHNRSCKAHMQSCSKNPDKKPRVPCPYPSCGITFARLATANWHANYICKLRPESMKNDPLHKKLKAECHACKKVFCDKSTMNRHWTESCSLNPNKTKRVYHCPHGSCEKVFVRKEKTARHTLSCKFLKK